MGNIDLILYVLALVLFILAGLNVPRYGWQWLAFACLVAAQIV